MSVSPVAATPRSIRADLPFRRVALVLSGGGALAAYEVGVLKVLERLALAPSIVAGVSSGAFNAVVWVAHGGRSAPLERVWPTLRNSTVGMRWVTLLVRAVGITTVLFAALEAFLTLAGSPEIGPPRLFGKRDPGHTYSVSVALDALAWGLVAVAGTILIGLSRRIEEWIARVTPLTDPERWRLRLGYVLIAGAVLHVVTLIVSLPWPHRFSATALAFGFVAWLLNHPGREKGHLRTLLLRLLPETGGRGLWGNAARRHVLEELVSRGDPAMLTAGPVRLLIGALAVDSGRTCHFASFEPTPEFREGVARALGEVIVARQPAEVILAAVASSAIPGVFEPVRIGGRDFVDPGGFSNQPLRATMAAGADAVIVVLLAPSAGPRPDSKPLNLIDLGGRLVEIANWRDLQAELRSLPPEWTGEAKPSRTCVVEPPEPLPGGVMDFSPERAAELIRRGEEDAWAALERAGWLAPA